MSECLAQTSFNASAVSRQERKQLHLPLIYRLNLRVKLCLGRPYFLRNMRIIYQAARTVWIRFCLHAPFDFGHKTGAGHPALVKQKRRYIGLRQFSDAALHRSEIADNAIFAQVAKILHRITSLPCLPRLEEKFKACGERMKFALDAILLSCQNTEQVGFLLNADLPLNRAPCNGRCAKRDERAENTASKTKPVRGFNGPKGYDDRQQHGKTDQPYDTQPMVPFLHLGKMASGRFLVEQNLTGSVRLGVFA